MGVIAARTRGCAAMPSLRGGRHCVCADTRLRFNLFNVKERPGRWCGV